MIKIFKIITYIFAIIGFAMTLGFIVIKLGWTKTSGIIDNQHDYFQKQAVESPWSQSEEWQILKDAIKKDAEIINKVSTETGIPARLIVSPLVVEQLRLFTSEREIFKQIFAPLKMLGVQSQYSWGVMGIKQDTAREIEDRLSKEDSHFLVFKTSDHNTERFERLTNEHDRYYSYLYAALYIKELEKQWSDAGFPISDKPGVIATLYNIGFKNSKPHINPDIGGAEIEINKTTYSFGGLAQSFYDSTELTEEFPK